MAARFNRVTPPANITNRIGMERRSAIPRNSPTRFATARGFNQEITEMDFLISEENSAPNGHRQSKEASVRQPRLRCG